jgi:hypothetical protein
LRQWTLSLAACLKMDQPPLSVPRYRYRYRYRKSIPTLALATPALVQTILWV